MNKVAKIFLFCIVAIFCLHAKAGEKIIWDGLHSVSTDLTVTSSGYIVNVNMLSVKCFTPSINRKATTNFAKRYALTAIARYLKKNALSSKSCEIVSNKSVNDRFIADIRITGVSDVIATTSAEEKTDKKTIEKYSSLLSDDLFSRKDDWIRVVDSFFELLQNEVSTAAAAKNEDDFFESIAVLDNQRIENCHSVLTHLKNDIMLLEFEREKIKEHISTKRNDFVKTVKQQIMALKKVDKYTDKFSDIRIKKGFAKYLYADLSLMEFGGARLFRIAPNKYFLVTIGSVTVKGNTPRSRIKQRKIAEARAVAELLKMTGVKVSTLEISKEKITVVKNGNKEEIVEDLEEYLKIDQEDADGWVQMLPEIGSWYSKDKNTFYISLGKFFVISN